MFLCIVTRLGNKSMRFCHKDRGKGKENNVKEKAKLNVSLALQWLNILMLKYDKRYTILQ